MQHNLSATWQEEGLRQLFEGLPFSGVTRHWQEKALSMFIEEGYPSRKIESWKYADIHGLLSKEFSLANYAESKVDLSPFVIEQTQRLVFVNGYLRLDLSDIENDILALPLDQMLNAADESLLSRLRINHDKPFFACLNSALMHQGVYIKVNTHQKVQKPLHILHISIEEEKPTLRPIRLFFDIDRNAEITILEETLSQTEAVYFNNYVTQFNLNFDARLNYYKLQRESQNAYHFSTAIAELSSDAKLNYHVFTKGALFNREEVFIHHYESGSEASLYGLFMPNGKQQMLHHTRADHFKGYASTSQHYRGIADDNSKGVFDGKVVFHPGANQSSVKQSNHNLLLSNNAEIDSKPNLEIYVDDVTASHGATVGQLDEQALFYLRSRGVAEDKARQLLVSGFAQAIFDELGDSILLDHIQSVMLAGG